MKIEYSDKRSKIDKVVAGLQREKKRERESSNMCYWKCKWRQKHGTNEHERLTISDSKEQTYLQATRDIFLTFVFY